MTEFAGRLGVPGRVLAVSVTTLALAGFLTIGAVGVWRYGLNYWLYRGFPPPQDPGFVSTRGTTQMFHLTSAALGGRSQQVYVYLPPGYHSHPSRHYPVAYLLHGIPGRPTAFLFTVRAGVVEDILVAKHKAEPMILVMPYGSTGTFTDLEWANGIRRGQGWETFVARDLVRAIDARYRTIPRGSERALIGLSEGGYGALNIGLHHPGEFRVLESWSGYEKADNLPSIFGRVPRLLAWNSPLNRLNSVAGRLRAAHTYVWFYSASQDHFRHQNTAFARLLKRERIPHRYFLVQGGHNWALWRGQASNALLAAARHLRA
jgi:enterochelin esterase-like enzyme